MRTKKPQSIANVLQSTLKKHYLRKKVDEYSALPHWQEIVGEQIAKVAQPEKIIRGKTLVVRVLDAAWSQELSFQKKELLDKVNNFGVGSILEEIQFITGNPEKLQHAKRS